MTNRLSICTIPGDGVGKEVIDCTRSVMNAASRVLDGPEFQFAEHPAGYQSYLDTGDPFPAETLDAAKRADGVLVGAFAVSELPAGQRNPLRELRIGLGVAASLRPSRIFPGIPAAAASLDLMVVREVTQGFYSGIEYSMGNDTKCSIRVITREASMRCARIAFEVAARRRGRVTVVHKVSALRLTDSLFIECAEEVAALFPDVALEKRNVDACAMELISSPARFDVILSTNCFGDILSDIAAALSGGIAIAPSACIGPDGAYFEPVHGTAPRTAGRGLANPIAAIRSASIMLEHMGQRAIAKLIDDGVSAALGPGGPRTKDLGGIAGSAEMTDAVIRAIEG